MRKIAEGFTDEEKRVRIRMIERGERVSTIAANLGLYVQDVSNVICGTSRSPQYIFKVYEYLELDPPEFYTTLNGGKS